MNIKDLISGGIGSSVISSIAKKLNIDEGKAKWVVAAAVPLMIAALNYNSKKSPEKAENIDNALTKHNGGILDQLGSFFGQEPTQEDNKIVNHMFGKNTEVVQNNLSEKTGLSSGQIGTVLATLAPIVMGYLGKEKQQQSGGGIGDLLGNILGGNQEGTSTGGGGILGSILGSVLGGGADKKSSGNDLGGLADLAGEFFNKNADSSKKGSILDSLAGMFGK